MIPRRTRSIGVCTIGAVAASAAAMLLAGCGTITSREQGDRSAWSGIKQDVKWIEEEADACGKQFDNGEVFPGIGSSLMCGVYGLDCIPSAVADTWHLATGGTSGDGKSKDAGKTKDKSKDKGADK